MIFPFKSSPRLRELAQNADRARDAKQWPEAALAYRNVLTHYPNRVDMWIQYGHALKESGYLVDAELAYRQAIQRDAAKPEGYIQLGHALKLQNRRDEAANAYREALRHDPDGAVANAELSAL
ncbi:tetratricopeptide repeat protein [Gluconobacter cerinus]|uniref:tetratricopeptide repeat protein n=1 Tax=Gluconobacter cerinus TaxID=38307 RepID=UPI001B8BCC88|nr:tetratricopeptide repeat protein [Gluconobacter cerinus]MBS1018296.1 tetratricopeptide repeat protein [Gluconobacter cerinus]MBS1067935.1 tetratricopeptide repeat protein [Gluconobacter cerinus]